MASTEFSATFKQLSLLRTSIGDLRLLCCLSVSLPQLKSLNNVLNTVNIYHKTEMIGQNQLIMDDGAFETCLKSNILLNYTTLTVHKL